MRFQNIFQNIFIFVSLKTFLLLLLSRFSCVRLCATPQTAAYQVPRPWDAPGKNTGVGCHFLLQCRKVKSESEVAQSCLTLSDPMDCSPPGSSIHGIFRARVLEWGAIAFSEDISSDLLILTVCQCSADLVKIQLCLNGKETEEGESGREKKRKRERDLEYNIPPLSRAGPGPPPAQK